MHGKVGSQNKHSFASAHSAEGGDANNSNLVAQYCNARNVAFLTDAKILIDFTNFPVKNKKMLNAFYNRILKFKTLKFDCKHSRNLQL